MYVVLKMAKVVSRENNNYKATTKEEILKPYLINGNHDFKSIFGLTASAIVSTIGVYGFLTSVTDTQKALTISVVLFVVLLIIVDTIKRGALTKYFNSILRGMIEGTKIKKFLLVVTIITAMFAFTLDIVGSFSTADILIKSYQEKRNTTSKEFELLEANAESGAEQAKNFPLLLSSWKEDRTLAYQNCSEKWKGWKSKYKADCKTEWDEKNPKPIQSTATTVKVEDYKAINAQNTDFITEYGFYIAFVLFATLTAIFQYLTIAKIYDDFKELEDDLSNDKIDFINDTIEEHKTIQANHEQQMAEMMADSSREKKTLDKEFKRIGEGITITHKQKRNETRGKTVMRIANNQYVPQEESKAGKVMNPFYQEPQEQQSEKWDSELVSRFGSMYSTFHFLWFIWNNGTAKKGDKLNTKVPNSFMKQFKGLNKALILKDDNYYANMDFYQAYRYFNRLGMYSDQASKEYEKLTGHVFSNSQKEEITKEHSSLDWDEEKKKQEPQHQETKTNSENDLMDIDNLSTKAIITRLWKNGEVKIGDKLTTKEQVINNKIRKTSVMLTSIYKEMVANGYAELRGNQGYFALIGYDEIVEMIGEGV